MKAFPLKKLILTGVTTMFVASAAFVPASAATPSVDTDGDGLLDSWEINGYDANGDGTIDLDFPGWGADPFKKDIFVEMDYIDGSRPTETDLDKIVEAYANMNFRNPDGTKGINIHLDGGSEYSDKYNLGGGNLIPTQEFSGVETVYNLRPTYSDSARNNTFHYMIWADKYGKTSSSGEAYVEYLDFLVTVGPTYWETQEGVPSDYRVGTFIHELGHNLGLGHGGTDNVNYKPNYLSVMNYSYQVDGVPMADGKVSWGYSPRSFPTIDENAVNEKRGLGASAFGYLYKYSSFPTAKYFPAHKSIDFNRNGRIDETAYAADINGDYTKGLLTAPSDVENVKFQPYNPNSSGVTRERKKYQIATDELTAEQVADMKAKGMTSDTIFANAGGGCGCSACQAAAQALASNQCLNS